MVGFAARAGHAGARRAALGADAGHWHEHEACTFTSRACHVWVLRHSSPACLWAGQCDAHARELVCH